MSVLPHEVHTLSLPSLSTIPTCSNPSAIFVHASSVLTSYQLPTPAFAPHSYPFTSTNNFSSLHSFTYPPSNPTPRPHHYEHTALFNLPALLSTYTTYPAPTSPTISPSTFCKKYYLNFRLSAFLGYEVIADH